MSSFLINHMAAQCYLMYHLLSCPII